MYTISIFKEIIQGEAYLNVDFRLWKMQIKCDVIVLKLLFNKSQ